MRNIRIPNQNRFQKPVKAKKYTETVKKTPLLDLPEIDKNIMARRINLCFILADIQDDLMTDILCELKKVDETLSLPMKRSVDRIKAHAESLVSFVDKETGESFSTEFGEYSDKIKEIIYKEFGLQ